MHAKHIVDHAIMRWRVTTHKKERRIVAKAEATASDTVKKRKTRTKADPSRMDPLDAQVFRLKQAHRIVKIGMVLDRESRALAIKLLGELAD
jgi:hypothetical protein